MWARGKRVTLATALIDRLEHHSVVIEPNVPSYCVEKAKQAKTSGKTTTKDKFENWI
ncbi:hypothetical protein CA13_59220 [Planctomycetes bacterium CA13]|uniref:Uncharacterized protein n=1 Tax=Novipirellula herctigrandis TaxID=2527986 RepID=A0A5C5ZAV6_9BACT|nr:hypothetical protein CA13_59220 [Planctomycetes bacterium CA13]